MVLDLLVLILAPVIFLGLLVWATLTPGNPVLGLVIGWVADISWLGIGTYAAIQRYVQR